ncbi:hypothetical protein [Alteribacter aurantiacus]|uniref:hypothetical protein n=1 Tax=Alteribacter aurantiacus TaxID=254410 RepID=UPI000403B502|nr:hypothetical protein [Alteribacter aurantiacus]
MGVTPLATVTVTATALGGEVLETEVVILTETLPVSGGLITLSILGQTVIVPLAGLLGVEIDLLDTTLTVDIDVSLL